MGFRNALGFWMVAVMSLPVQAPAHVLETASICPAGKILDTAGAQVMGSTLGFDSFGSEFTGDNQNETITAAWNQWEVSPQGDYQVCRDSSAEREAIRTGAWPNDVTELKAECQSCAKYNELYAQWGYRFFYTWDFGSKTLCCSRKPGANFVPAVSGSVECFDSTPAEKVKSVSKSARKTTGTCSVTTKDRDQVWHVSNTAANNDAARHTDSVKLMHGGWNNNAHAFIGSEWKLDGAIMTVASDDQTDCAIQTKDAVPVAADNICQGVVEITDSGDVDIDDFVCMEVIDDSGASVTSVKCHTGNIDGTLNLKTASFMTTGVHSYRATIRSKTTAGSEHYYHDDYRLECTPCVDIPTPQPTEAPTFSPTSTPVIACKKNHYYWGIWNQKPYCVQCPTGTQSQGCKDCVPDPHGHSCDRNDSCPKGKFRVAPKTCVHCPAGKWQPMHGQEGCFLCPAGTFQPHIGTHTCQQCPKHTFQQSKGQSSCQKCGHCPEGHFGFSENTGSSTKEQCLCTKCKPGRYSPAGYLQCFQCDPGKFQSTVGASECTGCPLGKFQPAAAATSCAKCGEGLITLFEEASTKIDCVKSSSDKHFCPAGRYIQAYPSVDGTSNAYSCNKCDAGRFGGIVHGYQYGGRCFDCPGGKFQRSMGKTHCNSCPHGYLQANDRKLCDIAPTHVPTASPTLQPSTAPTTKTTAPTNSPTASPSPPPLPTPKWHNYIHRIPHLLPDPRLHDMLSPWTASPTPAPTMNPTAIPIDCVMSPWELAAECSASCGTGFRLFKRNIIAPANHYGHCSNLEERRFCEEGPCPKHCEVSEWGRWTKCTKSCSGGKKTRTRAILSVGSSGHTCPFLNETIVCNSQACPVDCILGNWSKWSPCSATCGTGYSFRARSTSRDAVYGGKCSHLRENKQCATAACPVDCGVTKWTKWTDCSATCGNGMKKQHRVVYRKPAFGGASCPALLNSTTCLIYPYICPKDCERTKWGSWSECTISCAPIDADIAGTWNRTRAVKSHARYGGKACPSTVQNQECNRYNICPVHCTVTKWSVWTPCSRSCGGGTSQRSRSIKQKAKHMGAHCPSLAQSRACNDGVCPTPTPTETPSLAPSASPTLTPTIEVTDAPTSAPSLAPTLKPINCKVSNFTEWTAPCTRSCGTGYQTRFRTILQDPMHGGEPCPALSSERVCNEQLCPLDCEASEWSEWSECSVTCGNGSQTRRRTILSGLMHGGKGCEPLLASKACSSPCPVHCSLSNWTDWSICSASCGTGRKARSRDVIVHASHGGYSCPSLSESESCNANPCPVNCKVAKWSDWSACDKTCGEGIKAKTRAVLVEPTAGGAACPSPLYKELRCQDQECSESACRFSRWADWTPCSLTCGGGSRYRRRRSRSSRSRSQAAAGCPPMQHETEICNAQACPIDCVVNQWDEWEPCDRTCGVGRHTRFRRIHRYASMGGQKCPSLSDTKVCNTHLCPKDCQVGQWGRWERCSKSCDGGTRVRRRRVSKPAEHGGGECPAMSEVEGCNSHLCNRDCILSEFTRFSECTTTCGSGSQTRTRTVKVHPFGTGNFCAPLSQVRNCHFGHCPVDCALSEWSEFSRCTNSCNGGKQTRRRYVIKRPGFGGNACGIQDETWPCNVNDCPIDCQLSKWTEWSDCSASCTEGTHSRSRRVMLQPTFGGKPCPDTLTQAEPCTEGPCPVGCDTTAWNTWTPCSMACGTGTQGRMRNIMKMDPSQAGFMCPLLWETRPCNDHPCEEDCKVSAWTGWSECSLSCNEGLQYRTRDVTQDAVAGGKLCPSLSAHRKCNKQACPEDCELSPFGPWSPCTKTCGSGSKTRSKAIAAEKAYGGKECSVDTSEVVSCATEACPVDCVLTDWTTWGECTVSCGSGEQVRTREVHTHPENGGTPCGQLSEVKICKAPPHIACPIDCQVGHWTEWTDCSASCDAGFQLRLRPVSTMSAFGGKACASLSQRQRCNVHTCPTDCKVGRWSRWSPCSASCGVGRQRKVRHAIKEPAGGGAECPSLETAESCTDGPCPLHCVLTTWSEWTECTATCGEGSRSRNRKVEQHAFHGGYVCPSLNETQTCGGGRCPLDCEVTRWGRWSRCQVSCGGGSVTRTRRVRRRAKHGGRDCPVLDEETDCSSSNCPVDCVVSAFGEWSACSKDCGSGVQIRERSVMVQNMFGGTLCPALEERKVCNSDRVCPEGCQVSTWVPWTACSVTCGGGKTARWRSITHMPMEAGVACPPLYELSDCNTDHCSVDCELSPWENIGDCSTTCGAGTQQKQRKIVGQPVNGGAECPSEMERMTISECVGDRACPTQCTVTSWSEWGPCTLTCGMGSRTRNRTVTTHPTEGYVCPALQETGHCNGDPCPVACVLGGWSDWTECPNSCGTGEQTRQRLVVQPAKFEGAACTSTLESKKCHTEPCPEDCKMSGWGDWSDCTASCGGGSKTRSRSIEQENRFGGKACGNIDMWKMCNKIPCPVDCEVGKYSGWSPCSRSCGGGLSVRTRKVLQMNVHDGLECPGLKESILCNRIPCALDCVTGKWVSGQCSASCGGGTRIKKRAVAQAAADGGKGCPQLSKEEQCNASPCPVDCTLSDWLPLGQCSKTCGVGVRTEHRKIEMHHQYGGAPCTNNISFVKMVECSVSPECPTHCDVSGWSTWGTCDTTCASGSRTRTRSIVRHAAFGGYTCPSLTETRECDSGPCPIPCSVANWSPWSECSTSCDTEEVMGSVHRIRRVTQKHKHGGDDCPEMYQNKPCPGWRTKCPVHCTVSSWSRFSTCSKTCGGGGWRTRSRVIISHAKHGGYVCPSLKDTEPCGTDRCPSAGVIVPPTPSPTQALDGGCEPGDKIFIDWFDSAQTKTNILKDKAQMAGGGRDAEMIGELHFPNSGPWKVEAAFEANTRTGADKKDFVHVSINENDLGKVYNRHDKSVSVVIPKGQDTTTYWFRWFSYTSNPGLHMLLTERSVATCAARDQDCLTTQFTKWSECTNTCGGGWQSRKRTVVHPRLFGGKECPHLIEHRECNDWLCPWEHIMEAESAFEGVSKTGPVSLVNVQTLYKGYTGRGYLHFGTSTSEKVEWTMVAPFNGRYEVSFRYALGGKQLSAYATTEHMEVDHTYMVNCDFPNTGGWNHWRHSTVGVDLREGVNTISLTPSTVSSILLDSVQITHAKYLQHCKPGAEIPLHWLHSSVKNDNVVADASDSTGATVRSGSAAGHLAGRVELGAMGPWDIHLDLDAAASNDLTASINGKVVNLNAVGGSQRKIIVKDVGAHLSYEFAWQGSDDTAQHSYVLDGKAVCSGCSHTKCSFQHSQNENVHKSRITVHHHNMEFGGSHHQCSWDHNMDLCSCKCQFHPFISTAAQRKFDNPTAKEMECKNELLYKHVDYEGSLRCDRSIEWMSGGRLKMESRNGAYFTGIQKIDCSENSAASNVMDTTTAHKKETCIAKAACCNTGISQHREQQCREIGWTKAKTTTHLEKKTLKDSEQQILKTDTEHFTYVPQSGWSSCPDGFYVMSMTRRSKGLMEPTITSAKCCQDINGPSWGDCITIAAEKTHGWSTCPGGYFMTGILRNQGCSDLTCVSRIKCCKPRMLTSHH